MNGKCVLCSSTDDDTINLGKLMRTRGIYAHYYCVLMSSTIKQSGKDYEGIFGFLHKDIQNEIEKCKHKKCIYCGTNGATINCFTKKCNKSFHFPCGLKNNCSFVFCDLFETHCARHNNYSKIKHIPFKNEQVECVACFENVTSFDDINDIMIPPCCGKHILHVLCAKKLSFNSGYFTKCPVCNNVNEFIHGLRRRGIFVPLSDASWEERGAFSDQRQVHRTCDIQNCICPGGITYTSDAQAWKLQICTECGSSSAHAACLLYTPYVCDTCYAVTCKSKPKMVALVPYVKLMKIALPVKRDVYNKVAIKNDDFTKKFSLKICS